MTDLILGLKMMSLTQERPFKLSFFQLPNICQFRCELRGTIQIFRIDVSSRATGGRKEGVHHSIKERTLFLLNLPKK